MTAPKKGQAGVAGYEFEVAISASRERVWKAITEETDAWWLPDFHEETDAWWLPDFHMVGPGSTLSFEARAGGQLVERRPDGGSLLWYTVQWIRPVEFALHLMGSVAPDWGGPATSMLKLSLEPRGRGCVLKVSDALFGHIDEANLRSLQAGWTQLFTDGLKRHVEG